MGMPIRDVFTEEELPRGKVLLVGRSPNGYELGCVLPADRPEMWQSITESFVDALNNEVAFCEGANGKIEWFVNPERKVPA
jgi:hypothetical protein